MTVEAIDSAGNKSVSNTVRIRVGMEDLARSKPVVASSGGQADKAVDGDYFTGWQAEKNDAEWIYVDLGAVHRIDRVNLMWGWKIHPSQFTIDVAESHPEAPESWKTVHRTSKRPYQTWKATDRIRFRRAASARYVRLSATERAGRQNWSGYRLMALEVPVEIPR